MNHQFLDFKLIDLIDTKSILAQCSGNTEKGIFITFSKTDKALTDFLSKILSAVKLDLKNDVYILEKTLENNFSFGALQKEVDLQKAIIFGTSPQSIGLQVNAQKYQPFQIGGCQFLFADSLADISGQQALKKLLWVALKEMFG